MKATIGVLFKTDDIEETVSIIRKRKAFGDKLGLNTREKADAPKIVRIPAVTSISRKMMMICGFDNPCRISAGLITLPNNRATVAMKNVRAGLNHSRYNDNTKKTTINKTYACEIYVKSTKTVDIKYKCRIKYAFAKHQPCISEKNRPFDHNPRIQTLHL